MIWASRGHHLSPFRQPRPPRAVPPYQVPSYLSSSAAAHSLGVMQTSAQTPALLRVRSVTPGKSLCPVNFRMPIPISSVLGPYADGLPAPSAAKFLAPNANRPVGPLASLLLSGGTELQVPRDTFPSVSSLGAHTQPTVVSLAMPTSWDLRFPVCLELNPHPELLWTPSPLPVRPGQRCGGHVAMAAQLGWQDLLRPKFGPCPWPGVLWKVHGPCALLVRAPCSAGPEAPVSPTISSCLKHLSQGL